ncbi:GAF domain-containing sensor histidine kinase [Leptolyngbya sp. AN02str]|uniref:GAF domain-containing sensor histidine kinase n=1 Tax=Leptolyngbya sp. AN02str TaxID=3423363 RepID=UPI003D321DF5
MTLSGDTSLPLTQPVELAVADGASICNKSASIYDLVFTQDILGTYLSFYWQAANDHGLNGLNLVGRRMGELVDAFVPVAIAPYLSQVHRSLEHVSPQSFVFPFRCGSQYLLFQLLVSPILLPRQSATTVLVMGSFRGYCTEVESSQCVDEILSNLGQAVEHHTHHYQTSLTQIAWNIRRTLDLDTIWQQTVDGLGRSLDLDRCLVFPYKANANVDRVVSVAEFRQPYLDSSLNCELYLASAPHLEQAIAIQQPVELTLTNAQGQLVRQLIVPTSHQDQPNGLIVLERLASSRRFNDVEIALIRDLADQVGTGVAHACLFAESRNLTTELQRANASLMQQYHELEEARRQAEEASRLKSEFLANTSHELRTPLNGMIGFLKLIIDGMTDSPEEKNEYIEEAHSCAIHLNNILTDILDIAKIEAGKMQLDLNPVKLEELLNEVEKSTRPLTQRKHLTYTVRTPATHDDVILYGNYQRLKQVLLNLLNNAIKFTHEGGITITAEVIPKKLVEQEGEQTSGMVKISVADTGIGVSLEKQDKLFQSFSQVDGSRTRQYGGTGLGLAISQRLVEAMGGVVNFYSMGEGLGSTVTFTVPLFQEPVMIAELVSDESLPPSGFSE